MVKLPEGIVIKRQRRFLALAIPIVCLLVFFFLCLQVATRKSPTADEGMHILRGAILWQNGDLTLQGNHLPLSHWLIGSLLSLEPTLPNVIQLPSWPQKMPVELVQEFLWRSGGDVERIVFLGRLPIIFVGLFMGAVLGWWSRRQTGLWGQATVMVLFAFSPNLIGLTSLATTDLVTVAMILFALIFTFRFYQVPTTWRWLVAAVSLGLALSTKLSSGIILPTTLFIAYLAKDRGVWWKPAAYWLSMLPLAGLVVWGVYGFEFGLIESFPLPLPAPSYINSVLSITDRFEAGKSAYLLGQRSMKGWYHYFVVAFLVKTPAITLLLLLWALIFIGIRRRFRATAYIWFPALLLFAAASYSRFNIGYRHILALLPLCWLLIAETTSFWQEKTRARWVLIAAALLYIALSLRQQPDQLAYFNEFIGGSDQGMNYLGDSNIDWGQDLYLLADYSHDSANDPLYISYFGASDLEHYGLHQQPLFDEQGNPSGFSPANPEPGKYAISVNHIQGATANEPDIFNWFVHEEPVDSLGYSILIYEVLSDLDGSWIAHCYDPVPIVDELSAEQFVGRSELRHLYFDCNSSWVIPTGNQGGWYFIPTPVDPYSIDDTLARNLTLVYEVSHSARYQPFRVYYWNASTNYLEQIEERQGEATFTDGRPARLPLNIPGIATLEGSLIDQPNWGTVWRAIAPTKSPLSVMLHLYGRGNSPDVADGLGFSPAQWQPGDLIIQFSDYGDETGTYLETSLYDYTTNERLEFETDDDSITTVRLFPPTSR